MNNTRVINQKLEQWIKTKKQQFAKNISFERPMLWCSFKFVTPLNII